MNGEAEVPIREILNVGRSFVLPVGTPLQVEIDGITIKMNSVAIGYAENDYVIIKQPATGAIGSISAKLFRGNRITVRYVSGGSIFAFQSELIGAVDHPVKLIVAAYPTLIVRHSLRKDRRLDCHLPAELWMSRTTKDVIDDITHAGIIADISSSGCSFEMVTGGSTVLPDLSVNERILLRVHFPGAEDKVELPGNVKRIKRDSKRMSIGLQFGEMGEDMKRMVGDYITSVERFSPTE